MDQFQYEMYKQAGWQSWLAKTLTNAPRNAMLGEGLSSTIAGKSTLEAGQTAFKNILVKGEPIGQRTLQGSHYTAGMPTEKFFSPQNIAERTVGAVQDWIQPFKGNAPIGEKFRNAGKNFKQSIKYKPGEIRDLGNGKFVQDIHERTGFGKAMYASQMTAPGAGATAFALGDKSQPMSKRIGEAGVQAVAMSPVGLPISGPVYTGQLAWDGIKAIKNKLSQRNKNVQQFQGQYYNY
jgi:hypothetical protein